MNLAERVGFEPTCRLRDKTLSRRPRYDHFGTSPNTQLYMSIRRPAGRSLRLAAFDLGVDLALGLKPVLERLAVLAAARPVNLVRAPRDPADPRLGPRMRS